MRTSLMLMFLLMLSTLASTQERSPAELPKADESRPVKPRSCRILMDGIEQSVACQPGDYKRPVVLIQPEPTMSKEALKKKISGDVLVEFEINLQGKPEKIHVIRGFGYGLDEQAVLAAQKYVFKPATLRGQPVASRIRVDVNFQSH